MIEVLPTSTEPMRGFADRMQVRKQSAVACDLDCIFDRSRRDYIYIYYCIYIYTCIHTYIMFIYYFAIMLLSTRRMAMEHHSELSGASRQAICRADDHLGRAVARHERLAGRGPRRIDLAGQGHEALPLGRRDTERRAPAAERGRGLVLLARPRGLDRSWQRAADGEDPRRHEQGRGLARRWRR